MVQNCYAMLFCVNTLYHGISQFHVNFLGTHSPKAACIYQENSSDGDGDGDGMVTSQLLH